MPLTVPTLQLAHPVLESLKETEKKWLVDVLYSFNAGKDHHSTTCIVW